MMLKKKGGLPKVLVIVVVSSRGWRVVGIAIEGRSRNALRHRSNVTVVCTG